MKRIKAIAGLLLCIGVSAGDGIVARPYTVTDHLKTESFGRNSLVDPGGRWLVWEQALPYDRFPDYGQGVSGAWEGAGYRLQGVDLSAARPAAAPLFEADPQRNYWLDSFSPDGRYLLFCSSRAGEVEMGAYDFKLRTVTFFAVAPAGSSRGQGPSVWISPEEFVIAAYPPDVQPFSKVLRRYNGERLWKEWQKAWEGKETSVNEVNSDASGGDTPLRGRLLRVNVRTGVLDVIAEGLFSGLSVSADGRFLAALLQFPRVQPTPGVSDVDWVSTRSELQVFDLRKGGPGRKVAPEKDVFPVTLAWAPHSNRLAFFAWNKGEGVRSGIFHAIQAESGVLTPYPHIGLDLVSERERGLLQKPERVMWVDGKLAVFARGVSDASAAPRFTYPSEARFEALKKTKPDWFLLTPKGRPEKLTAPFQAVSAVPVHADARSLTVFADGGVWRLVKGREPRNLMASLPGSWAEPDATRQRTSHDDFPSFASFVQEGQQQTRFALVDLRDESVSVITAPSPDASFVVASLQYRSGLFRYKQGGLTHLVLRNGLNLETRLVTLNAHLADVTPSQWLRIKYTANSHLGARELESCALLPPDHQPQRRYPVIVHVYPGTRTRCVTPAGTRPSAIGDAPMPLSDDLLAARGYIVLFPNTSTEMSRTPDGPIAAMSDLVGQSVDALVAQGYADPARVGLYGVSQGGFSVLWLATQTPRFQAVVSVNGWADPYTHYFEGKQHQKFFADELPYLGSATRYEVHGGDFGLGASPYDNPMTYLRNSPLFNAPKVTSPVLLIHSDMDFFNLSQYEMMFTALYRQGKDAKFLRYWGEGHGTSSPANLRHSYASILAWYDRWLDVARTEDGNLLWESTQPASRHDAPPRSVEWFIETDGRVR